LIQIYKFYPKLVEIYDFRYKLKVAQPSDYTIQIQFTKDQIDEFIKIDPSDDTYGGFDPKSRTKGGLASQFQQKLLERLRKILSIELRKMHDKISKNEDAKDDEDSKQSQILRKLENFIQEHPTSNRKEKNSIEDIFEIDLCFFQFYNQDLLNILADRGTLLRSANLDFQ